MQSIGLKTFASGMRISGPLTWSQNITVPTIYFHVCGAIEITLGTLLDMRLNFISSNAAF